MENPVQWAIAQIQPHGALLAFIAYTILIAAFFKSVISPVFRFFFNKRFIGTVLIIFERDSSPNVSDGRKIIAVGLGLIIPSWVFFLVSLLARQDLEFDASAPFLHTLLKSALLAVPFSFLLAWCLLIILGMLDDLLIRSQREFQYALAYVICGLIAGTILIGAFILVGMFEVLT